MCFTGRINTGNTKPLMSVFFQQKKMMVVVVSMQQKAVVGKPPEWFLQGGEILITEFAYAGSRFARLCGFFWRLAHFFFCKDRWGFRFWSRYRFWFRVRSGQGAGSIQSVRRFTENGRLPVEAAKYLPSAVSRRKPWSFANVRFGGKSASESVTRQDTH